MEIEIEDMIEVCHDLDYKLSSWEFDFIENITTTQEAKKQLTEKQINRLKIIYNKVRNKT